MNKITNNWLTKTLFIISSITIVYALIVSGLCDGAIHAILPGSLDGSLCESYSNIVGCIFTGPMGGEISYMSPFRATVGLFIVVLFIFVASVLYLIFALPKLFQLRNTNENR